MYVKGEEMLKTRIIPCLLLRDGALVKTVKFRDFKYVGDPLNTCRIFNELEVDEMTILDIMASRYNREPDFGLLQNLASECFMPLSYGGGIKNIMQAQKVFSIGFEKIVINSSLFNNFGLLKQIVDLYGSQSLIVSIDIKKNMFGKYDVYSNSGLKREDVKLLDWVKKVEEAGAGEILLTNISREGTWSGFDVEIIKKVSEKVMIPVIAHGGAGCGKDIEQVVKYGGASAVGLGSMVVFQNKDMGVLINYNNNYDI